MPRRKIVLSNTKQLIRQDYQKALRNALLFSFPAILAVGASLLMDAREAGAGIITLYVMNFLLDLSKKWYSENKY